MSEQLRPHVAIILVNYNSADYTLACVGSIKAQTVASDYEIIVVDNGSALADYTKLEALKEGTRVKLVRSEQNLGFSGGNMLGVAAARPDCTYYFLLNNDTLLLNDVCAELVRYMEANPAVGVCTPQTYRPDGSLEASFTYFPTLKVKLLGHALLRQLTPAAYPDHKRLFAEPIDVPVVTGSAMFVRGSVFRALGGLDRAYFLYCEEEDFCYRVSQGGYRIVLVPTARFVHFAGGSGAQSLASRKEYYISLFRFYRKYYSFPARKLLQLFYALKEGRKAFRAGAYKQLSLFILRGAPEKDSARHRQVKE